MAARAWGDSIPLSAALEHAHYPLIIYSGRLPGLVICKNLFHVDPSPSIHLW